ncbi:MAG: type II toxin-antitoxin system RelE/ParE family toxin [Elusimicrobia bacterium]|nr:type II toxin-antitoxin system RelE/ParE family toxin [Elusimicrobiota bacterium]
MVEPAAPRRWKIKVHKEVTTRDSRRFDDPTKEKIKRKLRELLAVSPEEAGAPLRHALKGYRKLVLFEEYRVVYRVERDAVMVFVLAVGIRRDSEVYSEALRRLRRSGG